jgi:hypothetical protein
MLRANPGYMLIRDGKIEGKWSSSTLPNDEWFKSLTTGTKTSKGNSVRLLFAIFSITTGLIIFLLILAQNIRKKVYQNKYRYK